MILKITLDLPEDHAYLRMTRELGRTVLQSIQAVQRDIEDIDTVISELYANVIRHGHSEIGRFQVVLEYYADKMVIFVIDRGPGFSFADVPPPGAPRPDMDGHGLRIGGYGLELIKALADRIEFFRYDHQGTTVRAEKQIHYRTELAALEAAQMDESNAQTLVSSGPPRPQ